MYYMREKELIRIGNSIGIIITDIANDLKLELGDKIRFDVQEIIKKGDDNGEGKKRS